MDGTTAAGEPLAGSLTFRLVVLGATLQRELADHLQEAELTPKHLGVLNAVDQGLARSQDDVASLMQVTPATVVRLVDHVEAQGLLRRQRDPANRRKHILTVTDAGTRVLASGAEFAATVDRRLGAALGVALADHLDQALSALMRTLTEPRR